MVRKPELPLDYARLTQCITDELAPLDVRVFPYVDRSHPLNTLLHVPEFSLNALGRLIDRECVHERDRSVLEGYFGARLPRGVLLVSANPKQNRCATILHESVHARDLEVPKRIRARVPMEVVEVITDVRTCLLHTRPEDYTRKGWSTFCNYLTPGFATGLDRHLPPGLDVNRRMDAALVEAAVLCIKDPAMNRQLKMSLANAMHFSGTKLPQDVVDDLPLYLRWYAEGQRHVGPYFHCLRSSELRQ